jgi:integrase
MFNLAIDSKLRGCDVVAIKVEDIAPHGYAVDRGTVRQKKTGQPVRFELTEQTRQAVDDYIRCRSEARRFSLSCAASVGSSFVDEAIRAARR